MTKQREMILQIIRSSPGHLTADEIFAEAKKEMPKIALGTVYRNLGIMAAGGEIRKIDIPGRPSVYDRNLDGHEHIYCVKCGRVKDVKVDDVKAQLERSYGISVEKLNLSAGYICEKCKKEDALKNGQ